MLVLCLLFAQGCMKETSMTEHAQDAWLDSPDVLRVAFHPRKEGPSRGTAGFEVLDIPVGDGITVGARFYPAGPEKPTILFFHGNGEIVADYHDIARFYLAAGANFLPVDYRGYGRSSGSPTISSMLADARTVFSYARRWLSERKFDETVIVMGRSLGSASALEIAAAHPDETAGLIIDRGSPRPAEPNIALTELTRPSDGTTAPATGNWMASVGRRLIPRVLPRMSRWVDTTGAHRGRISFADGRPEGS